MSRLGRNFRRASAQVPTLVQRAINVLRKFGADAHIWLPGGTVTTYGPELVMGAWVATATGTVVTGSGASVSASGGDLYARAAVVCPTTTLALHTVTIRLDSATASVTAFIRDGSTAGGGTVIASQTLVVGTPTTLQFTTTSANFNILLSTSVPSSFSASGVTCKQITSVSSVNLNSLLTNNYILSDASTGLAPVDQYVGRASDALGGLGVELVTNGGLDGATGWAPSAGFAITGGQLVATSAASASTVDQTISITAGSTYQVTYTISSLSAGSIQTYFAGGTLAAGAVRNASGTFTEQITAKTGNVTLRFYVTSTLTATIDNISVREVTGIHATQPTTANKGQLKLVGNSYRWVFDATDNLACTIPAGWEAATTIDASPTGQVTLQNQNIVGTYLIGQNLTTSGRIILKTAPSASDLMLLQNLANRLAGL